MAQATLMQLKRYLESGPTGRKVSAPELKAFKDSYSEEDWAALMAGVPTEFTTK